MARKSESAKPLPTVASIDAHLASGNLAAAAVAARSLLAHAGGEENLAAYRRVMLAQAQAAIDHNHTADFNSAMKLLAPSPESSMERAILFAKFGRYTEAMSILPEAMDEKTKSLLLAHGADHAVRFKTGTALPKEYHSPLMAVLDAFASYEQGHDEAAREKLQLIPLASPFLEWKLLLRGLIAFTASEDAKALENWQRLNPARLPARLVQPLRARLDPAFRGTLSAHLAQQASAQAAKLWGSPGLDSLRAVQKQLALPERMTKAWENIRGAWSALDSHPGLQDQFAEAIYHAILVKGQPDDLKTYRKVLGPPPEDPDFHRLQALVLESQGYLPPAIAFWEKYEQWLASKPASWNGPQLARARAMILEHLGELTENLNEGADLDPFQSAIDAFLGGARKTRNDPDRYYRQAITADHTYLSARVTYVEYLTAAGLHEKAIVAARDALHLEPGNVPILTALAESLRQQKQYAEALAVRLQSLAANPLDEKLRRSAAKAAVAAMRAALQEGKPELALALAQQHESLCDEEDFFPFVLVQITILRKLGDAEKAAKLAALVQEQHALSLSAAFVLSVDATLAKLKPAQRTAANKAFTTALAECTQAEPALHFADAYLSYQQAGFEFRGQKPLAKKMEDLIERTLPTVTTDAVCDHLRKLLEAIAKPKFTIKICEGLLPRFPKNPHLLFQLANALAEGRPTQRLMQRIFTLLIDARAPAAAFPDLLAEIDRTLRSIGDDFGLSALDPFPRS